jgi:hypothetical protein
MHKFQPIFLYLAILATCYTATDILRPKYDAAKGNVYTKLLWIATALLWTLFYYQ